ncbi:trimeric intracellular cation channel family protein [Bosea sp. BIWAKO-01]|uniref:trimeric intracellular cation channel family protein n=1 Tax=Bosea sp. BIWAKO-01 TaxID=506668 RepID=UPI000853B587|nr:trimeric intracellular cation channel family protein [Bosea sp. BIWAKO-01]GAU81355.1 YghA protein [Bosea sp. BIWAKO-01]
MLEAAGVAVFALTGALVAVRKGMDPFGFILLATVTGVGGGTLRDLVLDRGVGWVQAPSDVIVCTIVALAAWATAYFRPGMLDGWMGKRMLVWADAAGLALFAVVGTQKALMAGVPVLSAVALGAVTASFGGILRDILAGDRPMVLWSRDFYVTAAATGATMTAILSGLGVSPLLVMLGGIAAGFGLRAGSILLGWSFPSLPGSGSA